MTIYKLFYSYDGYGEALVEAETLEEAEEKFSNGEADYDDGGENYCLTGSYETIKE